MRQQTEKRWQEFEQVLAEPVQINYFEQKDLAEILRLEAEQDERYYRMTATEFQQELRMGSLTPAKVCLTARWAKTEKLAGYLLYYWEPSKPDKKEDTLQIVRCVVSWEERYSKFEKALFEAIALRCRNAASMGKRSFVWYRCRESDLGQQILLHDLGFRAVGVERNYFPDSGEDAYLFSLREEPRE